MDNDMTGITFVFALATVFFGERAIAAASKYHAKHDAERWERDDHQLGVSLKSTLFMVLCIFCAYCLGLST